ncbi:DNA-directed RNA polymerase subunit omega [compost metagenome]|uniref:DNA-directed RNA polymerase subunit omega n=1 Tax=Paenibacillus rhizolycopersici TaxID=2780073 RepID=A0ABS2HA26_9BACL|nr:MULTISPECIES: DNA-directed RNA polymerase subunit omega [Paenibacillus]MBM6998240.1 DNA-directed RNA polymerase subunit omega [Paenibacillus rhizolycopersici]MUG85822.1 DNA-directed RNA polymerase subunit omega [Paenibacillus timonensis]GIP48042.1 DNA-directed RNA polymerase subunit omega [Paenibacillus sp. J53TS2]
MLYPSIDKMLGIVGSKYSLVVAASRRARQLREGEKSELKQPRSHKQVGIALEEIYGDYIKLKPQIGEIVENTKD